MSTQIPELYDIPELFKLLSTFSTLISDEFQKHGIDADCSAICNPIAVRNILIQHEFNTRRAAGERSQVIINDLFHREGECLSIKQLEKIAYDIA